MTVVKKKKQKTQKCVLKRKLKFGNYKNCLKRTQIKKKIKYLEEFKIDIDSVKELVKNNKSIFKIQNRFKSKRHNVFTEEINKIALNSNDDKRMQSIDSTETYVHGTSKDLVSDKEE